MPTTIRAVLPSHEANILPEADASCPTLYNPNHVFFSDGEDHKVKRSWIMKLGCTVMPRPAAAALARMSPLLPCRLPATLTDCVRPRRVNCHSFCTPE